jgi:hypothetical protein
MSFRNHMIAACLIGANAVFSVTKLPAQENSTSDWREELRRIDEEIREAKDQRDRYLAAARRAQDDGMRWQFMQDQKQEAKRAFQRAEDKKQAAQMLQARIDVLNARKVQILQEHPEALNDIQRSS